jgi:CHAD domain-containing protein
MSDRDVTVSEVVRRAFAEGYERLVENESALRRGDDPEPVHQARVATRRLRSDLRTFEHFVDAHWADDLRGELRWLGSELGAVRDLEVQRDRLRGHAARLPPAEAAAARRVVRRLDADRAAAKTDLLAMLSQARYAQLHARLASAAVGPTYTEAAFADAGRALAPVVRDRWKRVRRSVRRLGDNPPDEELHAVRVRAKRCRYAAEACEPVFEKRSRRLARAMADVQEVLGEHHDAVVAGAWLAKTAHECSPAEAYAIGMLAQVEREAAAAARAEFPAVWRRSDTERARGWL